MIDERILDQIIPVPDIDEKAEDVFSELQEDGFVITNTRSGGIFYTLVMIALKVHIELKQLCRTILQNMFLESASGEWLELKAGDFSKDRKAESRTEGKVTLSRDAAGSAITITKGTVFKTTLDANGDELKYIATAAATMIASATSVEVPVIAEYPGAAYNVATGRITRCLINLEGIDTINNASGWITKEGTDEEDLESLRSRTLLSWAELSTLPIKDKYKNVCEGVEGVFLAEVDDQHPRGQGTIDIYITSSAGAASANLISAVSAAVDTIKGPYDNVQVSSATTVEQNVAVTINIPSTEATTGISEVAAGVITELLAIRSGKSLNTLTHTDIIYGIRDKVSVAKSITVTTPSADVVLAMGNVLVEGVTTITVTNS